MAQGKNKPDLSDLKARLGLKKQGAAKTEEQAQQQAAPSSQNQQAQTPADGPGPSSGPAKRPGPAQGGPPQAGRPGGPPGASGPPPGAQAAPPGGHQPPAGARGPAANASPAAQSPQSAQPAQRAQPSRQSQPSSGSKRSQADSSARAATSKSPAADISLDDEDLKAAGGSTFSPATIILMVVLLGVGIIFGWMAANSMQNRATYNARSEDAARIHEALEANIANLDEAKSLVEQLDPADPDYEANKKLADLEIAPTGNILGGNRLLLGAELIDYVTNYTTDARMLEQMLDEHERLTRADREELTELVEGNEVVKKDQFAVLFDYDYLAKRSGSDDYMPRPGKLVTVPSLEKDEEGKIEVELLNSDRTVKTPIQGLLPLDKGDIMKSGGQNALNRYQARLGNINRQILKFQQYRQPMMTKLEKLAQTDSAPLLNF